MNYWPGTCRYPQRAQQAAAPRRVPSSYHFVAITSAEAESKTHSNFPTACTAVLASSHEQQAPNKPRTNPRPPDPDGISCVALRMTSPRHHPPGLLPLQAGIIPAPRQGSFRGTASRSNPGRYMQIGTAAKIRGRTPGLAVNTPVPPPPMRVLSPSPTADIPNRAAATRGKAPRRSSGVSQSGWSAGETRA